MRRRIRRPKRIVKTEYSISTSAGEVHFKLTRSTGRRTLTIIVDGDAQVNVAAPFNMRVAEIHDFIQKKAQWIQRGIIEAQKNKDILSQREFDHGAKFLFLGKKYTLHVVFSDIKRSRIIFDVLKGWVITISSGLSQTERRCQVKDRMLKWYRTQAEEILGGRIFNYARMMGVVPKKIAVRTQKRLWGCCDYNTQTIHLNWQIILSPIKVVDYVIIHELVHLTHPNHSKRFWNRVKKFMPDFEHYRRWLKINHLDMILP